MKIAHVTSILSRRGTGLRTVVDSLARAQQTLGHQVGVFGVLNTDFGEADREDWNGLDLTVCPILGPEVISFAPLLARSLEVWNPDVVHLHGLWTYPSKSVLEWHRATQKPYLISVHGMLSPVALSYSPIKKRISRWLYQDRCLAGASALHATAESETAEIRAFGYKGRICEFPNGVSAVDAPPPSGLGPSRTILSLGRLRHKKGLDVLIAAWAEIEDAYPDWRLRIVGPDEGGGHVGVLKRLIAHRGLTRCAIEGPLFGPERNQAMADAELFVLPSRNENFGMTVAESLMMGVPVIASRGSPWKRLESVGCGIWVDLEKDALKDALIRMIELDDSTRRDMGALGRAWMLREFSWGEVAARSLDVYRSLIDP